MRRELILLRHAKSDWAVAGEADFDRPLTDGGKKEAPRVGKWLRRRGLAPDLVVSSPAKRARQTTRRVCEGLGYDAGLVVWDPQVYGAEPDTLLEILGACPGTARRVLLVGHNPGLEQLVALMHSGQSGDYRGMPPAAVAVLSLPKEAMIEPGIAKLAAFWWP